VIIDEANHAMELIVPDDQQSLAIGRKGQNVRLAAQLTGWKLDINSESRVREMREFASRSLGALPGSARCWWRPSTPTASVRPGRGRGLSEVLAQIPGLDPARIPAMQEQAKKQMVDDEIELRRLEMEREQARAIEARRHPTSCRRPSG
jgi:N utilization substance protein A